MLYIDEVILLKLILHRIVAQPFVYDAVQYAAGMQTVREQVRLYLHETAQSSVVDLGAGTGLYLPAFPPSAHYLWLDLDRDKLRGFQARYQHTKPTMLSDGTQIGLRTKSVDYATCIAVLHHLDDHQLSQFVAEVARVVRKGVIILDPLATEAWISRMLWKYDRGSFPRTAHQLVTAFAQHFELEQMTTFKVYHQYVLFRARPIKQKDSMV